MEAGIFSLENLRQLPFWFPATVTGIFAGLLGSFINVCIYRIPLGQSIVTPRSRCTSCGHVLGVPDLVPVFSWLILKGRCRYCSAPVSSRYTLVELLIIAIWLGSLFVFGLHAGFLLSAVTGSLIVTIAGIYLFGASVKRADKTGLTFLEILFTAIILAAVVGPFINVNYQGRHGAVRNRERIIAYSLAREKLEELRCKPVRLLVSDWEIYRGKASGSSRNIFRDEFFGTWAKLDEDQDAFWENMTDIITRDGKTAAPAGGGEPGRMPETVFDKFKRNFKQYYGFDYEPYPPGYTCFRRVTRVEDLTDPSCPANILKRVIVTVEIRSKVHHCFKVTLASYFSDN